MPKSAPIQTSFTAGELSPRLDGRTDIAKYFSGVKTLENMVIHTHGGASRRGGFKFLSKTKTPSTKSRLIPFQFSTDQVYMLEVGVSYIHFYRNEQKIGGGDFNNDFNSDFGQTTNAFELTTTYTESELFEIQYVQSADVLYLVHPAHPPAKVSRLTETTFSIADVSFTASPFSPTIGYPSSVAFYESRLVYAGATTKPQTIWGSKTNDYDNFTAGANDDDSYEYTINSDQVNSIRWLSAGKSLVIGTTGGEFLMSASSREEAITPSSVKVVRQSEYGSAYITPIRTNGVVLFVQGSGKKLRQFIYQFESDSYVAPDLTLLSEHITQNGVVEIAHQREPDSTVWMARQDGALIGLTYERDQEVVGWHRHIIGGVSDALGTQAVVESVAVIPKDNLDQLWVTTKRYINSAVTRSVEVLEVGREQAAPNDNNDFFVDSGVRRTGSLATVIGGADHLEGQEVQVLADGAVRPNKTVTGGQITLDAAAENVNFGLGYISNLETMRLDSGSANGTAQGKIKRINKVNFRFYETLGCKFGPNKNELEIIPFRSTSDKMDSSPPRFSGDIEESFPNGYDTDGRVYIRQDQPLPFTVLAIMPRERTNG
jgi:hypothetical protein